jgi:hypothetical protein
LRFDIEPFTWNNFKKEFKFTLNQKPGELKLEKEDEEPIIRFELIR